MVYGNRNTNTNLTCSVLFVMLPIFSRSASYNSSSFSPCVAYSAVGFFFIFAFVHSLFFCRFDSFFSDFCIISIFILKIVFSSSQCFCNEVIFCFLRTKTSRSFWKYLLSYSISLKNGKLATCLGLQIFVFIACCLPGSVSDASNMRAFFTL